MTKQTHIVVVEDDQWLAEQYVRILTAAGYTTQVANFGAAAMEAIESRMPNILLVDVLLPGGTIFTLLHELRSHADLASIPVIICTNNADQLVNQDLMLYGVVGVLDKTSMLPEDLVAMVKKALL